MELKEVYFALKFVTYIAVYTKNSCSSHAELVSASYNYKIPKQVRNDMM